MPIQEIGHPGDIERRSMEIIESEMPEPRRAQGKEWTILRRMIHTTADFELADLVRFHPKAVEAGLQALRAGKTVITDTEMARVGIPLRRMKPLGVQVVCLINDDAVVRRAAAEGITRAKAAADAAVEIPDLGVYVVGNAPTALLRALELIEEGRLQPDLVVGMPVGFVNAAESKEALLRQGATPFISIEGRKGGSAVAASVVNALADLAL